MFAPLRVAPLVVLVMCIACSEAESPGAVPSPATQSADSAARETPSPSSGNTGGSAQKAAADPTSLTKRGRAVYTANCIACHNPEPSLDGAIGPAIAGSSLQLLEARVMRNEYPEHYKPKRDTKAMIALPYLEPDLPALAAFLAR